MLLQCTTLADSHLQLSNAAGSLVTFAIQLRSQSNVALRNVAVTAPPHITSGVQCGALTSPFTLAVGQEVTCRASYRFTHTDLQQSDMIQSFTVSGPHLDIPAQRVVVKAAYGCDTCSACISQFADACRQNLPLSGSAAEVAKALGDFCLTTGRPDSSCTALRELITSSNEGWRRGLRAAAVCMQLKECVAGGQSNSTTRHGSCENPRAAATSLSGARINGERDVTYACKPHWCLGADVLRVGYVLCIQLCKEQDGINEINRFLAS
jgi:hypothetical protein